MGGVWWGYRIWYTNSLPNFISNFPNFTSSTHRQARHLFPKIVEAGANWKNSPAHRSQALKFMQVISQTVKNLKRDDYLSPYLQEIGGRHVKFAVERGFSSDYWPVFREAIYDTMKKRIETGRHKGYGHIIVIILISIFLNFSFSRSSLHSAFCAAINATLNGHCACGNVQAKLAFVAC
jgi:hypothetical protein